MSNTRVTDKIFEKPYFSRVGIIKEIIQPNIEKEQQTPKIQYFRGFLYAQKIYQTPSKHTKTVIACAVS